MADESSSQSETDVSEVITYLNGGCSLYCRWYDTGKPPMDASAMAYELVTYMRVAIQKLKTLQEDSDAQRQP